MNDNLFKKIKLIQEVNLELLINKSEFQNKLNSVTNDNNFNLFQGFNNHVKLFVGKISDDEIIIRPIKQLFTLNLMFFTSFKASYNELNNITVVCGSVSYPKYSILIPALFFVFIDIVIGTLFYILNKPFIYLISPIICELLILYGCYLIYRWSVFIAKRYIERELKKLVKL
jgi:hypothetical protein